MFRYPFYAVIQVLSPAVLESFLRLDHIEGLFKLGRIRQQTLQGSGIAAYLHLTGVKPTAKELAAIRTDDVRIALLRAALGSVADRAIIPMPDWLGLGAEAHLNTPGKLGGNWTWRAAEGFDAEPLASRIQTECEVYCRAKEPVEKEAKTSI